MRFRTIVRRHCVAVALGWFCCASGSATTPASPPDDAYPRAAAVRTMQNIAIAIEQLHAFMTPALDVTLPARNRFTVEHALAATDTALSAYALADLHAARAQALALQASDIRAAAEEIINRAENALTVGDYAQCEALVQTLAEIATTTNSDYLRMYVEEYHGILDRRHGNPDGAAAHQLQALELARQLGDDAGAARALAHIGTVHRDRGDFAKALDFQLQALTIGEKINDRTDLTYRNLALLYGELDDDVASQQYFDKAIASTERFGDPSHYASVYGSYSTFLNDTHDYAGALAAASETLALDEVLNDRPAVAFEQLESGRALLGLKRVDEAVGHLQAALEAGRAINQREIVGRSLLALAEIALASGDRAHARTLLDQAMSGLDSKRLKPQLAQAYALREQLAEAEGDPTAALRYAHEYTALREDLLGTATSRKLAALQARDARVDSDQKLALANEANALQSARLEQQRLQRAFGVAIIAGLALLLSVMIWRWLGVRQLNRALASRNEEIEAKGKALSAANLRLERQTEELYHAAITDPLTGVFNRGHLLRQLEIRLTDCTRDGRELALMLIDFDHFKQINDARGHLFGDRVLVAGVQTLRQWLDPGDLLGRYGGEEFIVAIVGSDLPTVRALAERLRIRVAETLGAFAPELHAMATISIGIAVLTQLPAPVRLEMLIEGADRAVYLAKANGRNRVMNYVA